MKLSDTVVDRGAGRMAGRLAGPGAGRVAGRLTTWRARSVTEAPASGASQPEIVGPPLIFDVAVEAMGRREVHDRIRVSMKMLHDE